MTTTAELSRRSILLGPAAVAGGGAASVREQEAGARPAIAHAVPSLDRYETVLLASPVWNVRA